MSIEEIHKEMVDELGQVQLDIIKTLQVLKETPMKFKSKIDEAEKDYSFLLGRKEVLLKFIKKINLNK